MSRIDSDRDELAVTESILTSTFVRSAVLVVTRGVALGFSRPAGTRAGPDGGPGDLGRHRVVRRQPGPRGVVRLELPPTAVVRGLDRDVEEVADGVREPLVPPGE